MKITAIPARELEAGHVAAWVALQSGDRTIDSPFFRPEFTQAVAEVRSDVEVAILEQDSSLVGFFPFQRGRGNVGRPVGAPFSDFHGLILRADHELDATDLIRDCGLSAWHFDHLLATQRAFHACHWRQVGSPYIDISRGFDDYHSQRRRAGSREIRNMLRKLRKLERELGPVRVEIATKDKQVLDAAIAWKADQYRKARLFNVFSPDWTRQLFRRLLDKTDVAFHGTMFALYVNDELQAASYCLRSYHVLHGLLTAYSRKLAKYSPGAQLLLKVVQAAQDLGIQRIDMGKGDEAYKQSFMSGSISLAEGSVDSRLGRRALRRAWYRTFLRVRESPLRGPLTVPWRLISRVRDQIQFR